MFGHDIAIIFIMLFIPALLADARDAGIGNLRVWKTREKKGGETT